MTRHNFHLKLGHHGNPFPVITDKDPHLEAIRLISEYMCPLGGPVIILGAGEPYDGTFVLGADMTTAPRSYFLKRRDT